MGHVLGAEKYLFLMRGRRAAMPQAGRVGGIRSIRGPEVSLWSLRVGLYMVSRLHRMRRRFEDNRPILSALQAMRACWCVKTPPLFYVVKGVPPLSPTSFGVLPLFPPEKRENGFYRKGCGVFTRQGRRIEALCKVAGS